jgi:hypothetical protein
MDTGGKLRRASCDLKTLSKMPEYEENQSNRERLRTQRYGKKIRETYSLPNV